MVRKILLGFSVVLLSFSYMFAQTGGIKGTIVDSNGEPLIGANVFIKGTTTGTITDVSGNFNIQNAPTGSIVVVASFIGYANVENPVEVKAGQVATINFTMKEDITSLDELVVIGYGTVKKTDATGSVSTVSSKDFNKGNVTSPQDLIVGKTAGVVITTNGGAPGSGATIRIRGGSSLTASNDPLVIVDGVPLSNDKVGGSSNVLSFINPNDIETFTVLKDASATAIYGSRASNGVILITTKKGKAGKPMSVSYNGSVSIANPVDFVNVYDSTKFKQLAYEKFPLGNHSLLGNSNTDWQSEIFRTAVSHDHNISVSGATKLTDLTLPYRFSVGYTDQTGILKNTDMQRMTGSVNLNPSLLNDDLKVDINAKVSSSKHNFGDDGAIGSAISMDPSQSVHDTSSADGYFQWQNLGLDLGTPNPVEQAMAVDNRSNVLRFVGNVKLEYKLPFLPDLAANLNLATDYSHSAGHNNRPVTSPTSITGGYYGKFNEYENTNRNHLLDFYLSYNKTIADDNKINATAGYSWQHFQRESADSTLNMITDDAHPYRSASSAFITENYLVSFFGRANYSYKDKYLLTGTVRYDGSSRFAKDNRWGLFPSAAFAWKINKEAFLADVSAISNLKLRLGWGVTGQQNIINNNDYPSQTLYIISRMGSYYPINGQFMPTLRPNSYDPNIKWEETTTQNAAIDFGLMDDRFTGTFDVYDRVTKDMLNSVTVPSGSNFSNRLLTNVGSLENKGFEVTLNAVAISTSDMSLNIGANLTYNKSKITKLLFTEDPNFIGILYGDAFTGYNQVTRVGYPAYSFFVNRQIYDTNGKPIEGLYEDISGKGGAVSGNAADKYIYHNPAPDYVVGLSLRFNYKQFDLAASTRANIGNYVQNKVAVGSSYDQMNANGYWKNMPAYLDQTQFTSRQFTSDYFIENASFFKVDNISAGYNFENIVDKMNLRVSLTIQNVLTITKYDGLDPEVDGGIDNNFYPRPRTYTLGLSLNF